MVSSRDIVLELRDEGKGMRGVRVEGVEGVEEVEV
jgi:hypothetical protein